jgi:soluble lytic murein transglycosylase-like protein
VNKLAPRYDIDANLAMTFIAVESGFNVHATSPKNAQGLMQLIPETAQRFGVKDPYKAEDNIKGGLAYLQWLLAYFKGDLKLVAAAYNAGEGAVEKYKGVPPYAETQMYVKKVAKLYNNTSHPYKDNLLKKTSSIINLQNMQKNKTM